jgi:hypothetical protein
MDTIAEEYVKLVLGVGRHDADYVDAYYGPPRLKEEADRAAHSLPQLADAARATIASLGAIKGGDDMSVLRREYLHRQLRALLSRVEILQGKPMSFDDESMALYDAVAPTHPESHFRKILAELDTLLPGKGPVHERYDRFRNGFVIPREKLDGVFSAAIAEGRRRTREHIPLPTMEKFVVEYVTGKSWSGYNWFKGNACSLIQVNVDFPITIDRAVDLACHEGYPGHHVYNSLLEEHLVRKRGWVEFSVYALFSPQSLIAEGTANYGIDMALPGDERVEFERDVLFPLAGLDPSMAGSYYDAFRLFLKLNYAGNEAARRYLNGTMTREQAARWLGEYALMSPDRAMQRTKFFDQYRSYVINYNLGQDLVKEHLERRIGVSGSHQRRWEEFAALLASPRLPSALRKR